MVCVRVRLWCYFSSFRQCQLANQFPCEFKINCVCAWCVIIWLREWDWKWINQHPYISKSVWCSPTNDTWIDESSACMIIDHSNADRKWSIYPVNEWALQSIDGVTTKKLNNNVCKCNIRCYFGAIFIFKAVEAKLKLLQIHFCTLYTKHLIALQS